MSDGKSAKCDINHTLGAELHLYYCVNSLIINLPDLAEEPPLRRLGPVLLATCFVCCFGGSDNPVRASPTPSHSDPSHFQYPTRTGDFLPILITELRLANRQPADGDEVGVFIADSMCVGSSLWQEGLIGIGAWMDDETTDRLDGFRDQRTLTFRFWDASADEEIGQVGYRNAEIGEKKPDIWVTSLNFNTPIEKPDIPFDFGLGLIYPNPFNSRLTINFTLKEESDYNLMLFDVSGRIIARIISGHVNPGRYSLALDGTHLASGTYSLQLSSGNRKSTSTIHLVR